MICPLTRNASLTYSTASTMPEKSFLITDLDSTIVVLTGRVAGTVISFFARSLEIGWLRVQSHRYFHKSFIVWEVNNLILDYVQ